MIEPLGAGYGECRWAVFCKDENGVRTGKYIESDGKSVSMEGMHVNGKKSGVWTVYDRDGRVSQKIRHPEGNEASREVVNVK